MRYCLKDGAGWEGDGDAKSGGFVGAVRLSPVFVPMFSATEIVPENTELAQQGSGKGSVGQMIKLAHKDMQDNVLLELIIARELHLMSKKAPRPIAKRCLLPALTSSRYFAKTRMESGILFAKDRVCLDQRQGKEGHETNGYSR
jgi:hypothetical protein